MLRRGGNAMDAPRFMRENGTLMVERPIPRETPEAQARFGQTVVEANDPLGGGRQCIYVDQETGVLQAASDGRKDGCALGY